MSRKSFSSYLVIENWSVEEVQQFLEKNSFGECCEAFKKRNIDGHAFLTLTEGQLMLWKRELSVINIRKLFKLIQDLAQHPEKYIFSNSEKNGTSAPPFKELQFSTFKSPAANQSSLQKPRGTAVGMKNTGGDVASTVSNTEFVGKHNLVNINTAVLDRNCVLHAKKSVFQHTHNSETSSSCSDNCSWDTNFSDDNDEEPLIVNTSETESKSLQQNGGNQLASGQSIFERADSILSQLKLQELPKPKPPGRSQVSPSRNGSEMPDATVLGPDRQELQKPQFPLCSEVPPSRSTMPGEPPPVQIARKLPTPPIQQLQDPLHVKKICCSLNMPAAVKNEFNEQWDDEEPYVSVDNEHLTGREVITAFNLGKVNSQKSSSQLSLNSPQQERIDERSPLSTTSSSQKALQNGWSQSFEQSFPTAKMSSRTEPPRLPERSSTTTVGLKPPVLPASKRLPPSLPIASRPLPPQPGHSPPVPRSSSVAYREPARIPSSEEAQYEPVDDSSYDANDGNVSDEYEPIRDHSEEQCAEPQGCIDYYLPPVSKQINSEPARPPLPPKPAPSLEIPSLEPPLPPVRQSEDSSNTSSPGNSGDGVTGLLGEIIRKVRNKPSSSTSSIPEREKTPTPEVKKPQPLPPPDHKPPPPVDRPSAYQNQRPLPPTPESSKLKEQNNAGSRRGSRSTAVTQMPWYHNVDRKGAAELLRNSVDGTFILRPSSQAQNPLSLTLWFNSRMYNISVRHRPDGKFALGYEKPNEESFTSIEELVVNYQSENLVLYSNGERTGRTLLTGWPPRRD